MKIVTKQMRTFLIKIIKFYQKVVSPFLQRLSLSSGNTCRHIPTCSDYTIEAIEKFGSFKGSVMGVKRIISCNGLSKKEYLDPVSLN